MTQRYTAGLFDRLLDDRPGAGTAGLTLQQLKASVARDLEDLLNTRLARDDADLDGFPACRDSVIHYGLVDFAGMCLGSDADRRAICLSLQAAIGRHEPRLRNVDARIEVGSGPNGRIDFAISGVLHAADASETVRFDAVLDAPTQQYSIRSAHAKAAP